MIRILHMSDLHFGTTRNDLQQAMLHAATRLSPDVIAISGDLTQRARGWQFDRAARFIASLPAPVMAVPGNHDVPLYNLVERIFVPWRRWRRGLSDEVAPLLSMPGLSLVGMNSVNPWSHQRGRLWPSELAKAESIFRAAAPDDLRIVVVHHPLEHPDGSDKVLAAGADAAQAHLAAVGTDVILCGHLHNWHVAPYAIVKDRRGMIQVQAGTTLSTRVRHEPNDFNLLEFAQDRLVLTRYAAFEAGEFQPLAPVFFARSAKGWIASEPPLRRNRA